MHFTFPDPSLASRAQSVSAPNSKLAIDLIFVLVVLAFALDSVNLRKMSAAICLSFSCLNGAILARNIALSPKLTTDGFWQFCNPRSDTVNYATEMRPEEQSLTLRFPATQNFDMGFTEGCSV